MPTGPAGYEDSARTLSTAPTSRARVVDKHRLSVGPDEIGVVDVEPVGDERDLHAGAGVPERLGGRVSSRRLGGVDAFDGLRVHLHPGRRERNTMSGSSCPMYVPLS